VHFADCTFDADIASEFLNCFNNVYDQVNNGEIISHACLRDEPIEENNDFNFGSLITVDQIDSCIRKLHLLKAAGPDDLVVLQLVHAHLSLVIHIKLLFNLVVSHGYIPHDFGHSIIVPLIKDKSVSLNSILNYRPIALTCVISKVFEAVILNICKDNLETDELQFGFKRNWLYGCNLFG
jgi:hypothetical protein